MTRRTFYGIGVIVVAAVALGAVANGPYYAIPAWAQKLVCATDSNCPRFIVLADWNSEAVLDRETGLVWQRSPVTPNALWGFAAVACVQTTLGNRKGWRLPTIEELASLVDPSVTSPGPVLPAGHPFQNVQPVKHWSASTQVNAPSAAWTVDFGTGAVAGNFKATSGATVWCVRGGQGVDTHS